MIIHKDQCVGCGKCLEKCPNHLESCDFCGRCTLFCPHDVREICGREYEVEEVLATVLKDRAYYENSGGGVTASGGECMLQIDFLEEFLGSCKDAGIHTAVDTAGHVPFAFFERILPYTDLFLYDVKLMDSDAHKRYVGVDNALILENLGKLLALGAPIWVRVPVIGGVNDTVENMRAVRKFLEAHGKPRKVELLPYHAMGEHKYQAIGKEAQIFSTPSEEKMMRLKKIFL
jgi:pyruvate formate lyase activating enzyme